MSFVGKKAAEKKEKLHFHASFYDLIIFQHLLLLSSLLHYVYLHIVALCFKTWNKVRWSKARQKIGGLWENDWDHFKRIFIDVQRASCARGKRWKIDDSEESKVGNRLGRIQNNWIIYLNLDCVFESRIKISTSCSSSRSWCEFFNHKCLFTFMIIVVGFTFIIRFFSSTLLKILQTTLQFALPQLWNMMPD